MTTKVSREPAAERWSTLFEDIEVAPAPSRRLLGDILVEWGLISQAELAQALELQRREGGRLGEILVTEGKLTLAQLMDAVSEQCGISREAAGTLRARLGERRSDAA